MVHKVIYQKRNRDYYASILEDLAVKSCNSILGHMPDLFTFLPQCMQTVFDVSRHCDMNCVHTQRMNKNNLHRRPYQIKTRANQE